MTERLEHRCIVPGMIVRFKPGSILFRIGTLLSVIVGPGWLTAMVIGVDHNRTPGGMIYSTTLYMLSIKHDLLERTLSISSNASPVEFYEVLR